MRIDGIGGLFIFSNDPAALAAWYGEMFGFEWGDDAGPTTYYMQLWARAEDEDRRVDTSFAIMKAKRPLAGVQPPEDPEAIYGHQPFMLNLRVRDLDALLTHLRAQGVEILGDSDEGYARFAWVRDPDGHRVELYMPAAE